MDRLKATFCCVVLCLSMGHGWAEEGLVPRTALLGAFPEEVVLLRSVIENQEVESVFGVDFIKGVLHGREVILVQCGVGKVNAAVTTTLLIDHFRPSEVIFTGIAGGVRPDLFPGDIVIAEKTTQHDYGAILARGFMHAPTRGPGRSRSNPLYFPADEMLLRLAKEAAQTADLMPIAGKDGERVPRIVVGVVATGDVFVASPEKKRDLRERHKADAVEMEGAAVAQVCYQRDVPCLILRCVSDSADENAVKDLRQFQKTAAHNSATLAMAIIGLLQQAPVDAPAAP